jgi:hypothetical protein
MAAEPVSNFPPARKLEASRMSIERSTLVSPGAA